MRRHTWAPVLCAAALVWSAMGVRERTREGAAVEVVGGSALDSRRHREWAVAAAFSPPSTAARTCDELLKSEIVQRRIGASIVRLGNQSAAELREASRLDGLLLGIETRLATAQPSQNGTRELLLSEGLAADALQRRLDATTKRLRRDDASLLAALDMLSRHQQMLRTIVGSVGDEVSRERSGAKSGANSGAGATTAVDGGAVSSAGARPSVAPLVLVELQATPLYSASLPEAFSGKFNAAGGSGHNFVPVAQLCGGGGGVSYCKTDDEDAVPYHPQDGLMGSRSLGASSRLRPVVPMAVTGASGLGALESTDAMIARANT